MPQLFQKTHCLNRERTSAAHEWQALDLVQLVEICIRLKQIVPVWQSLRQFLQKSWPAMIHMPHEIQFRF